MEFSKKIYIKIHNKRESIEDFVADEILKKIEVSKTNEIFENVLTQIVVEVSAAYLKTYNLPEISEDAKIKIKSSVIKGLKKANKSIQKQLKKGKSYEF